MTDKFKLPSRAWLTVDLFPVVGFLIPFLLRSPPDGVHETRARIRLGVTINPSGMLPDANGAIDRIIHFTAGAIARGAALLFLIRPQPVAQP